MYSSNSAVLLKLDAETLSLNFKTENVSFDQDFCPLVQCLPASFPWT